MSDKCVTCSGDATSTWDGRPVCDQCYGAWAGGEVERVPDESGVTVVPGPGGKQRAVNGSPSSELVSLASLGTLEFFLLSIDRVLADAPNDTLKDYFWQIRHVEERGYLALCKIVATLSGRLDPESSRDAASDNTLHTVARYLDVSYDAVRRMYLVYTSIVLPFERAQTLPPQLASAYYEEAARRSKKYGIDPVEALFYAEHQLADSADYTVKKFIEDIKAGLPSTGVGGGSETRISCFLCDSFHKASSDSNIQLFENGHLVAEGPGAGIYYCETHGMTKDSILESRSLFDQAAICSRTQHPDTREPMFVPRHDGATPASTAEKVPLLQTVVVRGASVAR